MNKEKLSVKCVKRLSDAAVCQWRRSRSVLWDTAYASGKYPTSSVRRHWVDVCGCVCLFVCRALVPFLSVPLQQSASSLQSVGRTVASSHFSALRVPDLNATPPAAFSARCRPPPTRKRQQKNINPNECANERASRRASY
ncbi:hypothetical protein ACLKA6_009938 [Drosophila palustris]